MKAVGRDCIVIRLRLEGGRLVQLLFDSKTERPSGAITTTVTMLGSASFCSQPGGPPGIVNSMPCESERVMQGLPMALANMQVLGRY